MPARTGRPRPDPQAALRDAISLHSAGRLEEAVAAYRRILKRHPRSCPSWSNLGMALRQLGRTDEGLEVLRRGARVCPAFINLNHNLGNALADAEREMRAAAARDERSADPLAALADVLVNQGRLDEARAACADALAREPDHAATRFQRARAHFLAGDYAAAWPDYASRRRLAVWRKREVDAPAWEGEEPAGRSILLYGEQGHGDTIQFARYAPLLSRRGAKVVLYVSPRLVPLLRRLPGVAGVVRDDRPQPRTDWSCSLVDVPAIWGAGVDSIPGDCPYLPARTRQPPLLPPARGFRVGIVWAGRPTNDLDRQRSCRLDDFAPLVELPGTEWVSFQVGRRAAELRASGWHGLIRQAPETAVPFDAAADALTEVDLVITVDTVMAHLAGAAQQLARCHRPRPSRKSNASHARSATWSEAVNALRDRPVQHVAQAREVVP